MIAIIGPDASGKSTMVAETTRWLGSVFRVQVAHLGKPPSTWLTWLPNRAGRLLGRLAPNLRTSQQPAGTEGRRGLLYRLRAVLLAWDRRALAIRLARKAARGWIIVCDRYPSAAVGAPDSARLKAPEEEAGLSRLHAFLARLENRLYREIPLPQVVIRLNAPVSIAIHRNRERQKPCKEADDFVARRHKDFFVPSFAGTPIIEVDTSASQVMSVRMLRRLLWEWLCGACVSRSPKAGEHETHARQSPFQTDGIEAPSAKRKARSASPPRFALRAPRSAPLVVEFIGATGVGKSTLIAAVAQFLSDQGLRVCDAEEAILACYGLAFLPHPKVRSALTLLLGLPTFGRFFLTREGARLSRLAFGSIGRGIGAEREAQSAQRKSSALRAPRFALRAVWTGASLFRNFMKRIGSHFLLERLRDEMDDYDVVIWDEGIVHAAHNLFVHAGTEPKREEIEEFGRLVPKPDLLIWVTAPTAQSANVLLWRGHSRVRPTSSAAQTFAEHAQITFEVLSRVGGLRERIYRVDNSASDKTDAAIRGRACVIGEFLIQQLHRRRARSAKRGAQALFASRSALRAPRSAERDSQPTPSVQTL